MSLSLLVNALDWPLDNWQAALAPAALVVILILFITAFKRSAVSRAKSPQLRGDSVTAAAQLRQLGDVGRNAPGLIARE